VFQHSEAQSFQTFVVDKVSWTQYCVVANIFYLTAVHAILCQPGAQAQVELKVLQHLRHHDPDDVHHVIHIQEHFMFRNHLCITFELLSINLYEFIKQNNFQGLSLQLIRRFAQQMLVSLRCAAGRYSQQVQCSSGLAAASQHHAAECWPCIAIFRIDSSAHCAQPCSLDPLKSGRAAQSISVVVHYHVCRALAVQADCCCVPCGSLQVPPTAPADPL